MGKPITNPIFPFPRVAARFFQQTITQLEVNTMTQCIYPQRGVQWLCGGEPKAQGNGHVALYWRGRTFVCRKDY